MIFVSCDRNQKLSKAISCPQAMGGDGNPTSERSKKNVPNGVKKSSKSKLHA